MVRLDRASSEPIHQQLYRQIRDELVSGSFSQNSSRLPSSRALALDLGISRLTVNLAFAKLHDEGYLETRIGSGVIDQAKDINNAGEITGRAIDATTLQKIAILAVPAQ